MNDKNLNRRKFLKGSGTLLALPALETFASKNQRSNQKPPKRLIFLGFGFGVTQETWYPDKNDQGKNYTLPKGLAPLKQFKQDFSIIQGCKHKFSREGHWGSTYWLSGANRFGTPGQSFSNTISADQVAVEQFWKHTRYSSIQLSTSLSDGSGHGPGLSLAWDRRGKPIAGWNSPLKAFHKLFSTEDMPLSKRRFMLSENRSVLDAVRMQAKDMQKGLSKTDTNKLEEYFQGIRDIEKRLSKTESWMEVPKAKAPFEAPAKDLYGPEEIEVMYRLLVAALQTDSTRVITYRQPVKRLIQGLDVPLKNPHAMSHYTLGTNTGDTSEKRDEAQGKLLAGLFKQLKSVKEVDGSSLFDNVALAYGSNIRSIHYLNNCPTLLAGGAANLKLGQNIVLEEGTPLNNVWLTMLQGVGVKVNQHGDSTGIVKELLA